MSARYRTNVKAIIDHAKKEHIPVILIKQPMTTRNEGYRSMTYEEEYKKVLAKFNNRRRLKPIELNLIGHYRLVVELENIAQEENVPIVDNISIVDRDRWLFATYVHLTEQGNLALAEALKSTVESMCFRNVPASARLQSC